MQKANLLNQFQRNAVAIISLVVALTGLGYNTWRNEQTEGNRNQRFASFMVLSKLNELQELVFYRRYDPMLETQGDSIKGWAYVLTIHDLAQVLPAPLPDNADKLSVTWELNWEQIENDQKSADAILAELDEMRDKTILLLNTLK
ncbi:hypothetical protein FGD67_11095 [Colwellia sp. M166]|jgi:hypothetical protein|uniref:hypothetical protein n=1 Tax=Colwellia sp. M166 TaxID=2583805 RepID=UPI00211DF086|nr:hypothetical protein [Colwellia sp. M166]UUO23722.1 hypothetical protein FGD67_11095 [Colwellia sp. M166]|tara:strand:- start:557 stop:991 length:435 start_codon:yes stop_codon:yes gene_type:complete